MTHRYRPQPIVLPATLVLVMVASVFQLIFFSILAAPVIDDIGISRTELGVIGSLNLVVGALTAPYTGHLTDRLGAGRSVIAAFVVSALGLAIVAWSPDLVWLGVGSIVGGLPQGSSNPATNALIAARVEPGRRGTLTGVKQSGVTLTAFVGGLTLPALEGAYGWRGACWVYVAAFLAMAVVLHLLLDADAPRTTSGADDHAPGAKLPLDPIINRIAAYAFFMGLATGPLGRFLPLYGEETLGFSVGEAGVVAALGGLLGMGARIGAAWYAEHRISPAALLRLLSLVGVAFGVMLASIGESTRGLYLLSPIFSAIGTNAWNAVAMLAVITFVSTQQAGRASGRVMFGFLGGMALSAPAAGLVVDQTGTYRPVWIGTAAVSAIAAAIMFSTHRRLRSQA